MDNTKWGTPAPVGVEPAPSADGPKELWLQLHGDCLPHEQSEPVDYTSDDVTWCWHSIHDSDVRYVRADLAADQMLAMGRVPLTYGQVVASWNEQADEFNQWPDIGEDEKIEWAVQCSSVIGGQHGTE